MPSPTNSLHLVILAAGKGTRMKSQRPKVLHRLAGRTLIDHVLASASTLSPETITVVVGHQADQLRAALAPRPDVRLVVQEPQLGTGHALLMVEPVLETCSGTVVLLSGDVPLLRADTLRALVSHHRETGAALTVLTATLEDAAGYGRIVREGGRIVRIVEHRDASDEERRITEFNSGIYAMDLAPLFDALRSIATSNSQGEYYLPDLVTIYRDRGLRVETVSVDSATEVRGVNSQAELAGMAALVRERRAVELMESGVTVVDPATLYADMDVEVGPDTVLHPFVTLEGRTRIGAGCEIRSGVRIKDTVIGDEVLVRDHSVIDSSSVADRALIGPFSHIRPDTEVGEQAHIGNFVELKKTKLGKGSKANHLAYLGDATIGTGVNVGAGTITCNYDGKKKHQTIIGDGAFIGSDTQLIAPVKVGEGAYVAAGSSITSDVPPKALAIARARQVNKDGWADGKE